MPKHDGECICVTVGDPGCLYAESLLGCNIFLVPHEMGVGKSKQKTKDDLKAQIQEFNGRLQSAMLGCQQARKTFVTLSDLWSNSRQESLVTLSSVAEQIDRHHRNVNLASLGGMSSSIAGGAAGIGGLILSPFTGGLSLALSAGGLVGTVAGSATALGASLAEVYLTRELTDRVARVLETDAFYTRALSDAFREIVLHDQEVLSILSELRDQALLEDLDKVLRSSPCSDEVKRRFCRQGANSLEDILLLVRSLYPDDGEFLSQVDRTDAMFGRAPTFSAALSSSSEFFQAMKELATVGPETLKSISGTALQSTAASNAQMASMATQVISVGLGAVFVALDIYQFMKTSRDYDEGSKTELAEKMRNVAQDLDKEKRQITKLQDFYKQQVPVDLISDS